jgi:hypothetical protein
MDGKTMSDSVTPKSVRKYGARARVQTGNP